MPAEAERKVRTMFVPLDVVFQWEGIVPSHLCGDLPREDENSMKREAVGYNCKLRGGGREVVEILHRNVSTLNTVLNNSHW